ncbi:MAG: hypothetical protein ISR83_05585 [Candidatus Marinimicrobia bacterium]|nr:hypothetical protein [Candidatus Neomarinimicrobiota bacterium]
MNKMNGKNVLVYGMGTIGEPLIGLLTDFSDDLGLSDVLFHKRTPRTDDIPRILDLQSRGAKLVADHDKIDSFKSMGLTPSYMTEDALIQSDVVLESTPTGIGLKNKENIYRYHEEDTLGFVAQGSEFGFGKMYAFGINESALNPGDEKYIQVVSCNTHNISVLIKTLAFEGDEDRLEKGDFVCIRRANDVRNDYDYISSPQVEGHKNPRFGSHHAEDAHHLFETMGYDLNIFSSAMKLNTQYMHTMRFTLTVKNKITLNEVLKKLEENPLITLTEKTLANQVFSFGRDHGYYGRILNQTVVSLPTLHVLNENTIVGFCFTPQDGNALLSNVAIMQWFMHPETYKERLDVLMSNKFLFARV